MKLSTCTCSYIHTCGFLCADGLGGMWVTRCVVWEVPASELVRLGDGEEDVTVTELGGTWESGAGVRRCSLAE